MRYPTVFITSIFLYICFVPCSKAQENEIEAYGPTPSTRQEAWHKMDYYAFIHFNMNTFSNLEWGHGRENPDLFNPTDLDCRQWVRICKKAGMKGIIITAKHHDGFCLWPTKYSEHSVKNSSWRQGRGDVIKELSDACQEYGLKMGVYISPWDQNNPLYGTPQYNDFFVKQLQELLTEYGDIFEVWFDGAVSEEYRGQQIYDWNAYISTVRTHQPNAVIFSDSGPDVRWVGTERGFANPTNWCTLNKEDYFPGTPRYVELRSGNKNGSHWLPAEVDVSIRPGWYYHRDEDDQVKGVDHLEWIYYSSVGHNANLLLNIPVDDRGLIHENDSAALIGLRSRLDQTFRKDLAQGARVLNISEHSRNDLPITTLTDGYDHTFWVDNSRAKSVTLEVNLTSSQRFNILALSEYISLGQRIENVEVEIKIRGRWEQVLTATTVGDQRFLRLPEVQSDALRIHLSGMAPPVLRSISLYHRPHSNFLLESDYEREQRMRWWRDAGFGMFIHWGPSAVSEGFHHGRETPGAAEWLMFSLKVPVHEYEQYAHGFHPKHFDADRWVTLAKKAGMKYLVITSKHHDGFCLWDSELTTYDISGASPYGIDILEALRKACLKHEIPFGIYYSIIDWHHPDAQGKEFGNPNPRGVNFAAYREKYLKPQLRELINKYDPDLLWFDGDWIPEWSQEQGKKLYQYLRSFEPEMIINNRVGKRRKFLKGVDTDEGFVGDFGTPEQEILSSGFQNINWETCMTMNDSWGFKASDNNWKSTATLIHNLVDIASKGGDYLLNVGPDRNGIIPSPSINALEEMGRWLEVNGDVVYGSGTWPVHSEGQNVRYTTGPTGKVYITLLQWPKNDEALLLKYFRPKEGTKVYLKGYDSAIPWIYDTIEGLRILLPNELNNPNMRPCKYAWTLEAEGFFPNVAEAPIVNVSDEEQRNIYTFSRHIRVYIDQNETEGSIYYTLDGTLPTKHSNRLEGNSILVKNSSTLSLKRYKKGVVSSPATQIELVRTKYNDIELLSTYDDRYTGGGKYALIDGRYGTPNELSENWQGFNGVDLECIVDLGNLEKINKIKLNFLRAQSSWVFGPKEVLFELSKDGKSFTSLCVQSFSDSVEKHVDGIVPVECNIPGKGRFLRIKAKNIGHCPKWHTGSGHNAWLFMDEIDIDTE